jgi:hypothetical protein
VADPGRLARRGVGLALAAVLSTLLWRQEGLQETSDFQMQGSVSDTVARGQGAVLQAASEIGRKVVSLALDRF